MRNFRVLAFDADDTLWHNETLFAHIHERYCQLLAQYNDAATVDRTLYATEMRNLALYGYGVKAFMLSAIETAIELTGGKISAAEINILMQFGREMLERPVELLAGVAPALQRLAAGHELWLITKGDLREQERKIAHSGLAGMFRAVEIVSDKTDAVYASILDKRRVDPEEFLMVGNSLKSDVLPVLAVGGSAVHVPYPLTWEHERTDEKPAAPGRFFHVGHLSELPALLQLSNPAH